MTIEELQVEARSLNKMGDHLGLIEVVRHLDYVWTDDAKAAAFYAELMDGWQELSTVLYPAGLPKKQRRLA